MTSLQRDITAEEANKELVLKLFEDLRDEKMEQIDRLVHEDYVQHSIMGSPPGREGMKRFFRVLGEAFPDMRVDIEDIAAEGDKVFLRARATGTWTGEWLGKKPNGRSFDVVEFDEFRIEDGRIAEHWDALDIVNMMRQLSILSV